MFKYQEIIIASVLVLLLGSGIMVYTGLYNSQDGLHSGPTATVTVPAVSPTQNPPVNNSTSVPKAKYLLYFFEQPGCEYCVVQQPKVETWAVAHCTRVTLKVVDTWQDSSTAARYAVRTTPTTVMTDLNGKALKTWVGEFNTSELTTWLNTH